MDKIARVSGRLKELGRFSQQPREFRYSHIVLARDGASESVPRVIMPAALNKMLEIGAPVDLYLARKGPWHFCYAVEVGSEFGESYDGYRLFYVFNRSMMFINIMAGVFLLGAPGTRVAGAGLLAFGVLFAWLGPPTIGRMRAFLLEHRRAPVDADGPGRPDGKG